MSLKTWPVFQDFDDWKLIRVAQDCQQRLQQEDGLQSILADARRTLPEKLHDTAYAAAFEVATVDLEMRMEELRVLEMIQQYACRSIRRRSPRSNGRPRRGTAR